MIISKHMIHGQNPYTGMYSFSVILVENIARTTLEQGFPVRVRLFILLTYASIHDGIHKEMDH